MARSRRSGPASVLGCLAAMVLLAAAPLTGRPQAAPSATGPAVVSPKQTPVPIWPVTGGSHWRQGYSPLALPKAGKIRWRQELPGTGVFGSSPVVDGAQRIFLVTNETLTSTPQGFVWCLDNAGNVLWSAELNDEFEFQPVLLASGRLLLYSLSRQLYAYAADGEFLWRRQYSASPRVGDSEIWANYTAGLHAAVQVQALPDRAGGVLLVDDSPALLRVDGQGKLLWTTSMYGSCAGGLMLLNDMIYVPACDGKLHIYRLGDGRELPSVAIGGAVPFYPTGQPGGGVFAPVANRNLELLQLLPFPGSTGFEYSFELPICTPVTLNARSEIVIGIGRAGANGGETLTESMLVGLDSTGKFAWSRDFRTLPAGQIIADAAGRCCFGTQDIGSPGVYMLSPQHGVEWWISTQGASTVFPVATGLIGVQVTSERPNTDKNMTLLLGVGE